MSAETEPSKTAPETWPRDQAMRAAFAAIGEPVMLVDGTGRILHANTSAVGALGLTLAELTGTSLSAILPAGGVPEFPVRLVRGVSLTVPARLSTPIAGTTSIELRLTRLDVDGAPLFACVLHPLDSLAFALYNQLTTLLDQAPWICFQKDMSGRYEYVNRRYAEVRSVSQQAVVGRTDADMFPSDIVRHLREHDRIVAESGRVRVSEETVPEHDGLHFFRAYKFPIRDPAGRITSIGGMAVDVTESRHLKVALEEAALAEQQRFIHELHDGVGQELAGLSLLTANLIREFAEDNAPLTRRLEEMLAAIARAGESCRDIAQGLMPIKDSATGLRDALQDLVDRFARITQMPKISFREEHSAPLQVPLEASNHLYRIAQEALANAVKHSRGTRVVVSLHVDQELARLSITDDGRGVESQKSEGMGMRTMRHRADAISARFTVHAAPNGGTEIICERANRAQSGDDATFAPL